MALMPPTTDLLSSAPVVGEASGPSIADALTVLAKAGWPQDVVILDWETYFADSYTLDDLSTIEYVMDRRFEELGVACLIIHEGVRQPAVFWPGIKEQLLWLQDRYGESLERCTVVAHNARFDGTILVRKHEIVPPFVVDTRDLSRHLDARNTHKLKNLCERYDLPPKGDTMQFKGKHWTTMTQDERAAMSAYACNDAEREADLFALLLPRLTRPEVELPLQQHTLRLFVEPGLEFDFALAEELLGKMDQEAEKTLESVAWVLG